MPQEEGEGRTEPESKEKNERDVRDVLRVYGSVSAWLVWVPDEIDDASRFAIGVL